MPPPVFYLIAGPNGAGKSSLYRAAVADGLIPAKVEFVNADLHEAAKLRHIADPQVRSEKARFWADARRTALLKAGTTFVSETVFSHESKLTLVAEAKRNGFAVVMLVVCLDNTKQLLARVQQRVQEGGHHVPAERILARYPRTLNHLARAVRMVDMAILFDTGNVRDDATSPPRRLAVCRGDETKVLAKVLPEWARKVLDGKLNTP